MRRFAKLRTGPIFLTKEGKGDLVRMSLDAYENMRHEWEVTAKPLEAEKEAGRLQYFLLPAWYIDHVCLLC